MPYVEGAGSGFILNESSHAFIQVIFIHELTSDMRGWQTQLRHFSRAYRLHRL